jgi:putative transport protein
MLMIQAFSQNHAALFLIIAVGILAGHIKIKGISLDASAVIFVALIFGHFGVMIPSEFSKIGIVLFIFTIGIQAGPGFFESFKSNGIKYIITAIVVVVSGALLTIVFASIFNIDYKIAVGLYNGALTSTPGLAAAIESTDSPLASIGYGIAYPFGVIGVILFVRLLPRIMHVDLKEAESDYKRQIRADSPKISNANFIVENMNIDGKAIGELNLRKITGASISRVMKNDVAVTPSPETVIYSGDLVKAVGTQEALGNFQMFVGKKSNKKIPLSHGHDVQWVLVTNKNIVNRSLAQLNLMANYNATVTRIRRSGIEISPRSQSQLRLGDKLMIACDKENMTQVIRLLGNNDKKLSETDFLPIALGIVLGIVVGELPISIFGYFSFKLGLTGGVLTVALILSRIGKTGPIVWTMSGPANQLLRTLGLFFFLSAVGTNAGAHLVETFVEFGPKIFLVGVLFTLVPMVIATFVGLYFFKINFLILLGILTGGMTSTPGLAAVDPMCECNAPHVAYATVYPVALVCIIICSQIIGRL